MKTSNYRLFFLLTLYLTGVFCDKHDSFTDDNDFAEFEDFDTDDEFVAAPVSNDKNAYEQNEKEHVSGSNVKSKRDDFQNDSLDDDGIVEDDDNEFEHFADEEEFEGIFGSVNPIDRTQKRFFIKNNFQFRSKRFQQRFGCTTCL